MPFHQGVICDEPARPMRGRHGRLYKAKHLELYSANQAENKEASKPVDDTVSFALNGVPLAAVWKLDAGRRQWMARPRRQMPSLGQRGRVGDR